MNLIEPLHSALVEREKQREAARKRYVELIRQATYRPQTVNAKDQQEFTNVCNLLNIPVDQALRDLNSMQVVKRTEEKMASQRTDHTDGIQRRVKEGTERVG